jgi:hypothetical protein
MTRTGRLRVACAGVILLGSVSIDARQEQAVSLADRLRGMSALQVANEAPGEAGLQCGSTGDAIRAAASRAVLGGGLKVSQDRIAPLLTVDLATVNVKELDLCVSSLRIVLSSSVVAVPESSSSYQPSPGKRIGQLEILSRQVMLWSERATHGDRVRARISELVNQVVAEIKLANQ